MSGPQPVPHGRIARSVVDDSREIGRRWNPEAAPATDPLPVSRYNRLMVVSAPPATWREFDAAGLREHARFWARATWARLTGPDPNHFTWRVHTIRVDSYG